MKKILLLLMFGLGFFGVSQAQFAIQNVLMEEFTGTWCQFCADGAYIMGQVTAQNNKAIAVAYHAGGSDPMTTADGDALAAFYAPSYPQALINRDGALYSRGQWQSTASSVSNGASVVAVSFDNLTYDELTREVNVTLRATFSGPETGDMRFNVLVTENNVTGGSSYDQVNADNGTVGHPYYGAGNPIPGFVHAHVFRMAADGPWGTSGQIPTSVNFGTVATYDYTFTIPASLDENEVHLVGLVQMYGATAQDREVLNAEQVALPLAVGLNHLVSDMGVMEVFPNPMSNSANIQYTLEEAGNIRIEVLNTMGQQVQVISEGWTNNGIHTVQWDGNGMSGVPVESGIYMVRLVTEKGQSLTKKLTVIH